MEGDSSPFELMTRASGALARIKLPLGADSPLTTNAPTAPTKLKVLSGPKIRHFVFDGEEIETGRFRFHSVDRGLGLDANKLSSHYQA
jgi:hypothetical protein